MDVAQLLADLTDERAHVDSMVADLSDDGWQRPTPAQGWSIHDQIWHLAYFDEAAARSLADPDGFRDATPPADGFDAFLDRAVAIGRAVPSAQVLPRWHAAAQTFDTAAARADPGVRAPWYGVHMSPASMVTARIMETWAHGVDIADTLGLAVPDSPRARHVVFLGWRAIPFAYRLNDLTAPEMGIRIDVTDHRGEHMELGPIDSSGTVTGRALDLALVVTQRRHWRDTDLHVTGSAREWIEIAQAFAGPPGTGRAPTPT